MFLVISTKRHISCFIDQFSTSYPNKTKHNGKIFQFRMPHNREATLALLQLLSSVSNKFNSASNDFANLGSLFLLARKL